MIRIYFVKVQQWVQLSTDTLSYSVCMVLVFISTLLVKGVDDVEVGLLVSSSLGSIVRIKGIFRVQYLSNLLLLLLSSSARLRFGGRLLPLLLAATRSPTGVLALSAKIS